jgi:regulator of protease activity HflC (stomatin/prohibitin superfamily)
MYREFERGTLSGWLPLLLGILALAYAIYLIIAGAMAVKMTGAATLLISGVVLFVGDMIFLSGLFMVNPNEGRVLQLFGKYMGTAKRDGLRWANPFYTKRKLSLRVRNFETAHMKVNDTDGNPVEIAAIVVWKVVDTAEATFHVDNYERFVEVQSEAAVRNMATSYPYDAHEENVVSLRGNTAQISEHLKKEIQDRLAEAGVNVIEARISHLAYAPEIAEVMLRRQQAGAIVAARQKIVEGAVGMVEMALKRLATNGVVQLDEERKAQMVSNMLVVLCGDRGAQPVVNAGTIYQ